MWFSMTSSIPGNSAYIKNNSSVHINLTVSDSGLIVHPGFPHFGASLDGIVQCDCCGIGVIEIKRPYSCREHSFAKVSEDSALFCLESSGNGDFVLKNHCYFYQIQLHMMLSGYGYGYGDFVVWRESELVVIRINKDMQFLQDAMDKATEFFKYGILPELIAKRYTRNNIESSIVVDSTNVTIDLNEQKSTQHTKVYCYCKTGNGG